ncbi:MAG: PAS domain S-box protein [Burkholderiales bacterium]|jgi:PAS domain S-box-containing protein|nr:PAS domain S-box protein [Burkholderiales bacterium]
MISSPNRFSLPLSQRYPVRGWYWLTPLVAIVVFAAMMLGILWWLSHQDQIQRKENLYRDVETLQQTLRLKFLSHLEALQGYARGIGSNELDETAFNVQARERMEFSRELVTISFINVDRIATWVAYGPNIPANLFRRSGDLVREPETYWAFDFARDDRRNTFTRPFLAPNNDIFIEMHVPVFRGPRFIGVVVGTFSLTQLIEMQVPVEIKNKYKIATVDEGGNQLTASSARPNNEASSFYELPLDPPGYGVYIRAYSFAGRAQIMQSALFWLVLVLSAVIVWSLFIVWRHTRRRAAAEQALEQETSFRRAMEDSVLTGMRALDLNGRIMYVNPAFCRMTGYSEHELIGLKPPFPYWPPTLMAENFANMKMVIEGKAPAEGIEVQMRRKNGSSFFARMYVSPLIDERGTQTGWMTSMTDITEPKRARENLAAAHERFTTVLEGLDAAVSVYAQKAGMIEGELLFANRYYQQLFGSSAQGHLSLSGIDDESPAEGVVYEVYLASGRQWFEVRRRRIEWVDGRIVQMQIATDISQRKQTDDLVRQQEEKVALTSRLITMGEMASSLAHELNQPLTAIANYSMGTVARVKSQLAQGEQPDPQDLLPALEKTSAQAQRAGAIIRRIREFVKRSEPNRQLGDIRIVIDDALGLVEIEAAKKQVTIRTDIEPALPLIPIDTILIEQVLINLLKNAIEAMSDSHERVLTINVRLVYDGHAWLGIDVIDRGHGIKPEVEMKLFEPFYTTKKEGMGMGLNICRSIIEFHQGRLWAENNLDLGGQVTGCTFFVRLPIEQS